MSAGKEEETCSEDSDADASPEHFATQLASVVFRWLPKQGAQRSRKASTRIWMSHAEQVEPPSARA